MMIVPFRRDLSRRGSHVRGSNAVSGWPPFRVFAGGQFSGVGVRYDTAVGGVVFCLLRKAAIDVGGGRRGVYVLAGRGEETSMSSSV